MHTFFVLFVVVVFVVTALFVDQFIVIVVVGCCSALFVAVLDHVLAFVFVHVACVVFAN